LCGLTHSSPPEARPIAAIVTAEVPAVTAFVTHERYDGRWLSKDQAAANYRHGTETNLRRRNWIRKVNEVATGTEGNSNEQQASHEVSGIEVWDGQTAREKRGKSMIGSNGGVLKRCPLLIAFVLIAAFASSSIASADEVYHSERLPFHATGAGGHPALAAGHIANIHPNGPVIGAIQEYMVNGARPNTDYAVVETLFVGCSAGDAQLFSLRWTTLTTNKQGDGTARNVISAEALAPFSGMTVGAIWTLEHGGVVAYRTRCTVGTID
jgi:hypothetical protein